MRNNSKSPSLIILGAGGHSTTVYEIANSKGNFAKIDFLDDCFKTSEIQNKKFKDKIIGNLDSIYSKEIKKEYKFAFVAIGNNQLRFQLLNQLREEGYKVPVLIHKTAYVSESAKINFGTLISANCVVQSLSKIGYGVILNTSSTLDHDTNIGNCTHICPGVNIAGEVYIGDLSFIGIGSIIIQNLKIGENAIVGAGSKVLKDINSNSKFIDK